MNVIQFKKSNHKRIVFCLVDRLVLSQDNFSKEVIKNQSDYCISSLYEKRYDVLQSNNEDGLLNQASLEGYEFAVVFSTGTEFINGNLFFKKIEELIKTEFFICGHVLDRGDAYYELHHQCYIINLNLFRQLGMPSVGNLDLGVKHTQFQPIRSTENYHDEYTPVWIKTGSSLKEYNHKCHGWNILKIAFEKELPVLVFDADFRNSKRHHYPESRKDFLKNLSWIYNRESECAINFVHTTNTEKNTLLSVSEKFDQLIIPASGTLYHDLIDAGSVVIYDYNEKSLAYWENHFPRKPGITYSFVKADLLGNNNLSDYVLPNKKTLVNLSNIFCYEGTAAMKPMYYRLHKENEIIIKLQDKNPDVIIVFSMRAAAGFASLPNVGARSIITPTNIDQLKKPTWHYNEDWN